MEKFLLQLYRHLPKWIKRLVSPRVRNSILQGLVFFDARPGLKTLQLQQAAAVAAQRGNWADAVAHWQMVLALSMKDTQDEAQLDRRTAYARTRLRQARVQLAYTLLENGDARAFDEICCRIAESLPDQRILKNDPTHLNLMRLYVQKALRADGVTTALPSDDRPRRIVICMDVLKMSDVHTHARVIFMMCKNLMLLHDDVEMHLVISGERYCVPTPITNEGFWPLNAAEIEQRAMAAFGTDYGSRFQLHMRRGTGLESVVDTCKYLIDLAPDVVLYGGGHKGMFSNESRLVRHCLHDFLPTAFFYIQSNNEVDQKIDMIIARGPHNIIGPHDPSAVRVQPYPTLDLSTPYTTPEISLTKHASKTIVSAIAGVRMSQRMSLLSDATQSEIFSILDRTPDVTWHMIGADQIAEFLKRNPVIARYEAAGRIKIHPILPMHDFQDIVENASLFYHMPGFTGGSGGASIARRGGVPIITFSHSDVAGRQPPAAIFDDSDVGASVDLAVTLLTNQEAWLQAVTSQIAHIIWIRDTANDGFYTCLTEAMQRAQTRLHLSRAAPDTTA